VYPGYSNTICIIAHRTSVTDIGVTSAVLRYSIRVFYSVLHILYAAALSFLTLPKAAQSHVARSGSITRLNSSGPLGLPMNMNAPSVENKALSGEEEAPPTNDKALPQPVNNTFAHGNYGFQAGVITGHVNAEFHHHAPGRPPARPELHAAES
jgi:hypothetical protein